MLYLLRSKRSTPLRIVINVLTEHGKRLTCSSEKRYLNVVFGPSSSLLLRVYYFGWIVFRLNKLPVNQGIQNKIVTLKREEGKMRSVRQRNVGWWVIASIFLWCLEFKLFPCIVCYSLPLFKQYGLCLY